MKEDVLKNAQVTLNEEKGKPEHSVLCLSKILILPVVISSALSVVFVCTGCTW